MTAFQFKEFSLRLDRFPLKIEGEWYCLQELDGNERDAALSDMSNRMRYNQKGLPAGIRNFKGMEASYIARGFYRIESIDFADDEEREPIIDSIQLGKKVPEKEIQGYPSRLLKFLAAKLREMSGMDEDAEEREGN